MAIVSPKEFISDWSKSPVSTTFQDLQKNANDLREFRRQRAIQNAMSQAVDAQGNFNPELARKSLFEQGFGESADSVVNEIAAKRDAAEKLRDERMQRVASLYSQGLISKEQANKEIYGTTNVENVPETYNTKSGPKTEAQILQESRDIFGETSMTPRQKIESKMSQDQSKIGEIRVPGSISDSSMYDMSLPQTSERRIVKTPAQITPDYLTGEGDIGKSIYAPIQTGENGGKIQSGLGFSTSGLGKLEKDSYKNYLSRKGIDVTKGTLEEQINQRIGDVAKEIPVPILTIDPKDPIKSMNEYRVAINEYPSKVIKAQNEELEKLRNFPGTYQSEAFARTGERRAEAGEQRAKFQQEVSTDPLTPSKNPMLARNVTTTELEKIKDYRKAYVNYQNATRSFEDGLDAAIAKAKIDGSVNWDNVVSNLVAMGAWPSSEAVALKQNLDPNVPVQRMAVLAALDEGKRVGKYAKFFNSPKGASAEWVNKNVKELNSALVDAGGKPFTAGDQLEAKRSPNEPETKTEPKAAPKKSGWYKDADGVMRKH